MSKSILCVCLGNICRSPTGEALLRAALPGARIDSAGTAGWHVGKPPYGPMQAAARERGYDLSAQRARQVTTDDFYRFDLILAMDSSNLEDLQAIRPTDATAELSLYLSALADAPRDVPDPYYTRDFDGVLTLIEKAAGAWAEKLV
ncbi:low molecular weight protein-tyrosine-phosphatase [Nioella aestuarii]|uniref:low molecular weight protein-tyrosine-phosphatase n=1 Tax=Nioella aestuarii TaxID=1662864 RepID=UPI003D7F981C